MRLNGIFKYGRTCFLTLKGDNWNSSRFNAYLQPIRYKTKVYLEGDFTEIGKNPNDIYLYLGPAEHDLTCLGEDGRIVDSTGSFYKIDRAEKVYFKDNCIYIWAVVRKTTEVN